MSKKHTIILVILGIAILVAAAYGLFSTLVPNDVTITLKKEGVVAKLYKKNDKSPPDLSLVADVNTSTILQLQNGDYSLVPDGARYDRTPLDFTVKSAPVNISVDPGFSTTTLNEMLDTETASINQTIAVEYGAVINDFTVKPGKLYNEGEWFATIIVQNVSQSEEGDIYRTILKKENGVWKVIAKPALIIHAKSYPQIPEGIIRDINSRQDTT